MYLLLSFSHAIKKVTVKGEVTLRTAMLSAGICEALHTVMMFRLDLNSLSTFLRGVNGIIQIVFHCRSKVLLNKKEA